MMSRNSIREFYLNKNVLITGATGFMGMALVEKLLRSFPEIKKIYLIIRSKKRVSIETRIENYFDNEIFSTIKATIKNYSAKIVWIEGDVCLPKLGIQKKHLEEIITDVNIIIHSASSIHMNMPFKPSVKNNIGGTFNVLQLASDCLQLKAFLYVSTLFVNHKKNQQLIEERLYRHPIEPMMLLKMAEEGTDKEIALLSKAIIAEWYNFYLYTKNAAENLVHTYENRFPIGIFRPGLVMFTKAEPIPYWAVTDAGLPKVLEEFRRGYNLKSDMNTNSAPVDMAINGLIAAIYDTARNERPPKFYNYGSGTKNQLTGTDITKFLGRSRKQVIPYNSQAYREACKRKDAALISKGLKPFYVEKYKESNNLYRSIIPFMLNKYVSQTDNMDRLWSEMSEEERNLLYFDLSGMDWKEYMTGLDKALPPIREPDEIVKEECKL